MEVVIRIVSYYIDGFNVYHALNDNPRYSKYKWLNYAKLAKCFMPPKFNKDNIHISNIYYFTALAHWNQSKTQKHKMYIKALENEGVEIIRGNFRLVDRECRGRCKEKYKVHEEKQTDVNIATKLFQDAFKDKYETAILITGDSDLLPAISAVKSCFPKKEIGIVIPVDKKAEELKHYHATAFHMKMKEHHLSSSLFPDEVTLKSGGVIKRPKDWD